MPNTYFASNKTVSGGALFASWNSKDGSVFFKLLKQIANNVDKRGNFDGKNPVNVKLTQDEVADIVRAVRTKGESKFYHTFDNKTTVGSFRYYEIEAKGEQPKRSGFGLTVKKTADNETQEVKIGFNLGSAERLSLFLRHALTHIFDAEYSADLKEAKDYAEKQKKTPPKKEEKLVQPEIQDTPEIVEENLDF